MVWMDCVDYIDKAELQWSGRNCGGQVVAVCSAGGYGKYYISKECGKRALQYEQTRDSLQASHMVFARQKRKYTWFNRQNEWKT